MTADKLLEQEPAPPSAAQLSVSTAAAPRRGFWQRAKHEMLNIFRALLIGVGVVVALLVLGHETKDRFLASNAYGATANALEDIRVALWLFGVVIVVQLAMIIRRLKDRDN